MGITEITEENKEASKEDDYYWTQAGIDFLKTIKYWWITYGDNPQPGELLTMKQKKLPKALQEAIKAKKAKSKPKKKKK